MLRKARKGVELFSLLFIILVPFLSYVNTLREVYGKGGFHVANISGGWLAGKLFAGYELTLGRLQDPVSLVDSVKGTFWSITIFGLNISDPLASFGYILATKEVYLPLIASLLIPVAFTLVMGRAFCGWVCPVNTLLEGVDWIRDIAMQYFPWIKDINLGRGIKYWVLLLTLILIFLTGIPLFAYYLPYLIFGREIFTLFFFQTITIGAYFLVVILLVELFVSKRGWCRYLCPSGALLSLIGNFSLLKVVKKGQEPCRDICEDCEKVCPMGLEVRDGKPGMECTQCGECMVACRQDILGYAMNLRRGAAYCFVVLILLLFFFVTPARAHHMTGLPHYGYAENYPQVPLTEIRGERGDYVLSLTTIFFQGIKQELSNIPYDTQFYIHINNKTIKADASSAGFQNPFDPDTKDKTKQEEKPDPSYRGKLICTIMDTRGKVITSYSLNAPSEESIYRFRHYFSYPGDYIIRVSFFPDGKRTFMDLPVSIEVASKVPWLIITGVAILLGFGILLHLKKRKRTLVLGG